MRRTVVIFAFAATLIACAPALSVAANPLTATPEVVGKDLRRAIDTEYARLRETRTFKMPNTIMTSTVEPYLPEGLSFKRAEAILKAAGLTINPSRTYATWPNLYALRGKIDPYPEGRQVFGCRQTLHIALSPQAEQNLAPNRTIDPATVDWSQVRHVLAEISNSCL